MRCQLIFLLQLLIFITGFAQQPYFQFDRITTLKGLPSDNTKRIIQDKQGFIWIGTSEGLCRYDGYHVTTFSYDPSQPHSLVNNFIYDLSEDESGNIWIATAGGWCELLYNTVTFLNAKDFKNFHGKAPDFFVQFILADHHHHIIMGGYAGSCVINLSTSSFEQFHFSKQLTGAPPGLVSLYQDKQSLVWLEFQNFDCVYDPVKNKLYTALNNPLIKSGTPLLKQGNTLWVGDWSYYVCAYNLRSGTIKVVGKDTAGIKELSNDIEPRKMIVDQQGNLWLLLEEEGIYYMDFAHNNFQVIKNKANDYNSLPSQLVRDIMCDRDGNVWVATDKGIARWNNHRENFQQLSYSSYIPQDLIPATRNNFEIDDVIESDNEIWMAVSNIGLLAMNKNNPSLCRRIQIDSGSLISGMNRLVNSLMRDKNGNIWLSTQEGYARYDKQCDCLLPFFMVRHDITGNLFYQSTMMLQDSDGTIWLASKKGLGKLNAQTNNVTWFALPATNKTGVPFFISKIAEQNNDVLWLTTDGGLFSFNKITSQFLRYSSYNLGDVWKAFDDCTDVSFISDTTMMIASHYRGLIQFNPQNKKFKIYSTNNGLSSNNVLGLFADNYKALWITTMNGLSRLNLKTQTFSRYDYSNGLKDLTFPSNVSFYAEKDGNVLLPDGAYILRFDPAQFAQKEDAPKVAFTSFEKYDKPVFYNKPLNEMKDIHLAYSDRYFTIRFSTLNFQNTSRTQYAYKMEGLDNQWHNTNTPFVAYSNLSGGAYTLHVKASLDGNAWGSEKKLSVSVMPPFWKAWWFYAVCSVVIFFTAYSFYKMRINRLKHELYLRTKIARDLHDDVGSTLSSLHMVSALATKKISDDPDKAKELLKKITESSERMTGNMQDIVWAVNPLNDSFAQIIARMQKFAAQMLELKNIELVFNADEKIKSLKLPLQYRSDLFMIFKEAVNNLAKYSNATQAWISFYKVNKIFFLEIKDDGVGFNMATITKGNGLRNMKERAGNLNGRLGIETGDKKGTRITLEFTA